MKKQAYPQRAEREKPVLDALPAWLYKKAATKSVPGKGIYYLHEQWQQNDENRTSQVRQDH